MQSNLLSEGPTEARPPSFRPAACLFDLDGTLVDSEPLFELSERRLLGTWGIRIDEELKHELFGRSAAAFLEVVERRFPDNLWNAEPFERRLEAKNKFFFETARGRLKSFPTMERLARALAEFGVPLAIASSSNHEIIDFELETLGLAELFPVRVSAVDVPRGKPEPDVFIEAARRLGADPRRCVVFEDSLFGLRAAKASGAYTISLPAPDADIERFRQADLVVRGGPNSADPETLIGLLGFREAGISAGPASPSLFSSSSR